jgi:hypothetical protein
LRIHPARVNPVNSADGQAKEQQMFKSKASTTLAAKGGGLRRSALIGLLVLPALALPMQAAAADQPPLKGSETGTFQLLGPCETSGVIIDVTGTGHTSQLGNYSGHYRECLDPATGAVTGGTFTLTAANGDKVFGTYSGQAVPTNDPSVVHYEDPGVITGGTGRFAGASGVMTTSGLANLATGDYTGTITGSVSSPASG